MISELTNLLPRSSIRALRREYFVRLITVSFMLGTVLIAAHGALLAPAYIYVHEEAARAEAELARISTSASSEEEKKITSQISAVQTDITYLGRLGTMPTASAAVRAVIAVPHAGIKLNGFTYAAPSASAEAIMTVTGTASTRDALRVYVDALDSQPYVTKADLPISAYAKESAIPFTITLTGSLMP